MILDWMELRQFLADLWHRSTRARGVFTVYPEQHEVYTEAVASLVEQILDPGHMGGVTVLGLKTVLAVLTSARLRDRLAYLFREHSDHQVICNFVDHPCVLTLDGYIKLEQISSHLVTRIATNNLCYGIIWLVYWCIACSQGVT